jgi:MIP family channel proteins
MDTQALKAEFFGTFTLIFIGAGAVAVGAGGVVGAAFAHGLVLMAIAFAFGSISGAHINPAITNALWVGRQIDSSKALSYIAVQLLGGTAGALLLSIVLGGSESGLGATLLAPQVSPLQGLVIEAVLTFFLASAVFNTAVSGRAGNLAPIAIGFTVSFSILMGGPLTGASLNPARTIGPAIASGQFDNIWVYLLGTPIGGILAALLYGGAMKPSN